MKTVTIANAATESGVIKREGDDILCLQSDVAVTVAVHGRLNLGGTRGAVLGSDGTALSFTLAVNGPHSVNMEDFAGLYDFILVASVATAEVVTIKIGTRDLR